MRRSRSFGLVAVLVTGVGISAVAQDAADAKKQELQKLRDRVRQIDGQIGGMATFYTRDAAVVELDKTRGQAAAAFDAEINKRLKANEKGAGLLTEKPTADRKVSDMEAQWRALEAKLEASAEVTAARKQVEDIRKKAEDARRLVDDETRKVTAVITQKIEADAEAVKLRADMEKARRERDRIGGELNGLRNWLVQPAEIIAAEQAVTQAQADFTKAVEAAAAADAEVQKLTAIVTKLAPQRKELDAKVKAAKEKAEKSEEALALKKTLDDADKAAEEKRVAKDKFVEGKMAADANAVKLAADLKEAKEAPARQEIEAKIKAILTTVNEGEDVKAAKAARDEAFAARDLARKAYQEKLAALFTADTTAVEADGKLRELGQSEGQLQKLRRDIEQGETVKAPREALAAARTKLAETRASVTEKAQAAVATTDEGAKLVKEKAELDAKIKALTTP